MKLLKRTLGIILVGILGVSIAGCSAKESSGNEKADIKLLNVSYDPTRELYTEFNEAFINEWKERENQNVTIEQSYGGSAKQARSVIDGLNADVVTLGLAYDINSINSQKQLIDSNWQSQLPNNSTPYTSTIVFLVRKGNPKGIKDWNDLIKPGIDVITANPKTSSGARWNYVAAWGYALTKNNNDNDKARKFVKKVYENVPVLDSGSRGATTTFVERGIGDVLIAWENEAHLALKEFGEDKFEIVNPSISILAEPPVAIVKANTEKNGTTKVAQEYLKYLYSDKGQEIVAKNFYRPRNKDIAKKYKDNFPKIKLFTIDEKFGGWDKAQKEHFNDGGVFDQIYTGK